ncbi:MAG: type I pantothenate kinase [Hyphomicrobiales bacterium]
MDTNRADISPYNVFSRAEWARLRADTPLTLNEADLDRLHGFNDQVSMAEAIEIYLPLSRLLSLYVGATLSLFKATQHFLDSNNGKVPYIIGIGGSVAAGKTTTARLLRELLTHWPHHPQVELVTTDGFLLPNRALEQEDLMARKGFPESYDLAALLRFLSQVKSGRHRVKAPIYSHLAYDVLDGKWITIDRPDILIVEGLNVLQPAKLPREGRTIPFVSDFFDFAIYIDADETLLRQWYIERFLRLRDTAFRDPRSYFHHFATMDDGEAEKTANRIWESINLVNLRDNILPTRQRADLILCKTQGHEVGQVWLRKL